MCNHKSLPRPSSNRGGLKKAATEGGASETERPSLGRTQQRIELQMKTANFHCMRRYTIAALRGAIYAARFLFIFHARLLAVPHLRCESGSAPLQLYKEGGIPGTDGNAALVLFRGTQGGLQGEPFKEVEKL